MKNIEEYTFLRNLYAHLVIGHLLKYDIKYDHFALNNFFIGSETFDEESLFFLKLNPSLNTNNKSASLTLF